MMYSFETVQNHPFTTEDIFPLLCPVRENEWLDGWDYKMIHSNSGIIEKGCVFTTPHHDKEETVWSVTKHDTQSFEVSFVRVTPGKNVVNIDIRVEPAGDQQSKTHIRYAYVPLAPTDKTNTNDLKEEFMANMKWWEKAINYYLENGTMLKK